LSRPGLALLCAGFLAACAPRAPRPNLTGFTLATVDDQPFTFSDKSGQVLLITYFATWCFPCLAEVPDLIALHQKFSLRGFSVIAVGVDRQGATVLKPFRDYYKIPYPVIVGDAQALAGNTPFGAIVGLPTSFLIDREGRLVRSIYGVVDPKLL
jgi:thiol-disulfide isomerase/thioredoxin